MIRKQTERSGLIAITLCILLIMISIAGIVSVNVNSVIAADVTKEKAAITIDGAGLNKQEKSVLTMFYENEKIPMSLPENNSTYQIYLDSLQKYFSSSGVELKEERADQMKDKMNELFYIMELEDESNFPEMSIDGKNIAIDISKQIYKLCGLKLKTTRAGMIENILDEKGEEIYSVSNSSHDMGLHKTPIMITGCFIAVLFVIIILVTNKYHFIKGEVGLNGFDAQRFA